MERSNGLVGQRVRVVEYDGPSDALMEALIGQRGVITDAGYRWWSVRFDEPVRAKNIAWTFTSELFLPEELELIDGKEERE